MLPIRGDQQTFGQKLRDGGGLAAVVLHYAVCAFAIALGLLGFVFSVMSSVFDVEPPRLAFLGWITFAVILLWELLYRPSMTLTAAIGFGALLLLCLWIAANVLVSVTF